ncbi:hypothetical protein AMECASPLE_004802 [Ameca splendens]|uniref:Uncharacterized protein n=1 Tax=Ameca splendens TaxID=208324 RepID=A0ABV1A624_9TELE
MNVISSCVGPSVCVEWWVWAPGMDGLGTQAAGTVVGSVAGFYTELWIEGFRTVDGRNHAHSVWSRSDEGNMIFLLSASSPLEPPSNDARITYWWKNKRRNHEKNHFKIMDTTFLRG